MPEPILQAAALPFRRSGDVLQLCMITSASGRRWGFPKGIIEGDDSAATTALKEAHEEAGLQGRIVGDSLGAYRYFKWGTSLDVTVFLMEVSDVDDDWPESELRNREWVSVEKALRRIDRAEMQPLLAKAISILVGPLP